MMRDPSGVHLALKALMFPTRRGVPAGRGCTQNSFESPTPVARRSFDLSGEMSRIARASFRLVVIHVVSPPIADTCAIPEPDPEGSPSMKYRCNPSVTVPLMEIFAFRSSV